MINMEKVVNCVRENRATLKQYIVDGINRGCSIVPIRLIGQHTFTPVWFDNNIDTYDARENKDKILSLFTKNPGRYGYGVLLGKQPGGFYLVCIEIDVNNKYKEKTKEKIEQVFKKYGIVYYTESTMSGRCSIYVALDKFTKDIQRITKITFIYECMENNNGAHISGKIELLGVTGTQVATVHNGIFNNEKPFFIENIFINRIERFTLAWFEIQSLFEHLIGKKLSEFYKFVRKYNFLPISEINNVIISFCVKNNIPDSQVHKIFQQIYGEDYDEKTINHLLENAKRKSHDLLPGASIIAYHANLLSESGKLSDNEEKAVRDFIVSVKMDKNNEDNIDLPDYLTDIENVYLLSSRKFTKKQDIYYIEKYFVERNISGVKEVWYVKIESDEPYGIFKQHTLVNDPDVIGVKIEIKRLIQGKINVYEIIINDELTFIPSLNITKPEDIIKEIAIKFSYYTGYFDISLFQKYYAIKIREYREKNNGKLIPYQYDQ